MPGVSSRGLVVALIIAVAWGPSACGDDGGQELRMCEAPTPPPEALRRAGLQEGDIVLPDGRLLTPTGTVMELGGFPIDLVLHPSRPLAFVSRNGWRDEAVQVVDLDTGTVVQELPHASTFHGMAITADGSRIYVSGGDRREVDVYDVTADGTVIPSGGIPISGYPAGMALSEDGGTLWVASFSGQAVSEVDTTSQGVVDTLELPIRGYAVAHVPQREELYVSGFHDREVAVVDLDRWELVGTLEVGKNPQGLAVAPDGSRVFVAITDDDQVVAIDTAAREIVASAPVGEASIADAEGGRLPGSSPSALALDPAGERLYVGRAADNAVSVFDAADLSPLGAIPVAWYPTALTFAPDGALMVLGGKGFSSGPVPLGEGKNRNVGVLERIVLADLDLATLTAQVEQNVRWPSQMWQWDCPDAYPVPARAEGRSPIEHVVLIVRENKTYDALLGDLETGDGDPSLVRWGEEITPNLHALARRFTSHDNFYDNSENSMQGHGWLTASFVNDYLERIKLADFPTEPPMEQSQPSFGTWFTHLMRYGVDYTNYGEIVGTLGSYDGESVLDYTDLEFPGVFFNLSVPDQEKAEYVAGRLVDDEVFPPFVFVGLPNDHTYGSDPGELTPESLISDNDYATGLLVDRISHSRFWPTTAIFIVEDDPQSGGDHVDYHRSICIVASPWARRAHTSSVHTSLPSLFRTFELILGLPPMNRYDALATPLWDAFGPVADPEAYEVLPRTVPDAYNPESAPGAAYSRRMDFSGPDRNPDLGDLLWWYRFGAPPAGSRLDRELRGELPSRLDTPADHADDRDDGDDADDARDRDAYDQHWRQFYRYLRNHPQVRADLRPTRHPPLGRPFRR